MSDEWTSFSDIGKVFDGTILSQDAYLETEKAYIDCYIELIEKAKNSKLHIRQAEYCDDFIYQNDDCYTYNDYLYYFQKN